MPIMLTIQCAMVNRHAMDNENERVIYRWNERSENDYSENVNSLYFRCFTKEI